MPKPLLALFRQLVPKGFHERVLLEETQVLMEKLAKSNPVVIQIAPKSESLDKLVTERGIVEKNNYGWNLELED